MNIASHRIAGCASFAAWLPVTAIGLLMSCSILVLVGVPTVTIGAIALIASVRAAYGSRPATATIVIGALVILGLVLIPALFVANSSPNGRLGWMLWTTELALGAITLTTGLAGLTHPRR